MVIDRIDILDVEVDLSAFDACLPIHDGTDTVIVVAGDFDLEFLCFGRLANSARQNTQCAYRCSRYRSFYKVEFDYPFDPDPTK